MLSASQSLADLAGREVPALRAVQEDICRLLFLAPLFPKLLTFGSSANSNPNSNLDSPALLYFDFLLSSTMIVHASQKLSRTPVSLINRSTYLRINKMKKSKSNVFSHKVLSRRDRRVEWIRERKMDGGVSRRRVSEE